MSAPLSRRVLLRGASAARPVRRMPWTGENLTDACTRCGECISACPGELLFKGDGGFPEIRFVQDGCDFCGKCADSCREPVFDLSRPAFEWRAVLADKCLAYAQIDCRSCQDACEPQAIRFRPTLGNTPQPQLLPDACNGCGACLAVCPADAIRLEVPHV